MRRIIPAWLLAFALLGCNSNGGDSWTVVDLSGVQDSAFVFENLTEIHAAEDLLFADSPTCSVVFKGKVRLRLGANARIVFPAATTFEDNADVNVDAIDAANMVWRSLEFGAGDYEVHGLVLRNSLAGLLFAGSSSVRVENCSFDHVQQEAINLNSVESAWIEDCKFSFMERHCVNAEFDNASVTVVGCTFQDCETGLNVNESEAHVSESLFQRCSLYGIRTRLERGTTIQHNDFFDNGYHVWHQSTQGLVMTHNDFRHATEVAMKFVDVRGTIDCRWNNVQPNDGGYFINLSYNDLEIPSNWWSTTDSTTVQQGMYDGLREPERGLVHFMPLLTQPVADAGRSN